MTEVIPHNIPHQKSLPENVLGPSVFIYFFYKFFYTKIRSLLLAKVNKTLFTHCPCRNRHQQDQKPFVLWANVRLAHKLMQVQVFKFTLKPTTVSNKMGKFNVDYESTCWRGLGFNSCRLFVLNSLKIQTLEKENLKCWRKKIATKKFWRLWKRNSWHPRPRRFSLSDKKLRLAFHAKQQS